MTRGALLAGVVVACAFLWWRQGQRGCDKDQELRIPRPEFRSQFASTFTRAGCTASTVRALFVERARVLKALGELAMRMPNDPQAEDRLAAYTRQVDADMLRHIEDARQRCNTQLLHPGPVDDAWYGAWYRPANE